MTDFRTIVSTPPAEHQISLGDPVLTIGSCFATAMGSRLGSFRFSTLNNPFGVSYNPLSIHKAMGYALSNASPLPDTFLTRDDLHYNFDFHSTLHGVSEPALRETLNASIQEAHDFLRDTKYIIITYGTAWVYTRRDNGEAVSNCHKLPASRFSRSLLSQQAIIASFESIMGALNVINPGVRIILTVSPVRHLRDTPEGNSVSKAVLRVACQSLAEQFSSVDYFPAFEIMMDDLRDYRFYAADMIHPTPQAEDYIFEKFKQRYIDVSVQKFMSQWSVIQSALNHRPFQPAAPAHQRFLKETLDKLEQLTPIVNVDRERAIIQSQII